MQKIHNYPCNKALGNKIEVEGVELCFVDKMEKIFPNDKVERTVQKILAVKGEDSSFQVVVQSSRPLYNAKLFWGGKIKKYLSVRMVEYVPSVVAMRENGDDYIVNEGKAGVYPDLLRDFDPNSINIAPNTNYCFYFTVKVGEGLVDGEYELSVSLSDENGQMVASNAIAVETVSLELAPIDRIITNWMHLDCICDAHRVKPYSKRFYKIFEKYLSLAVKSGINTVFVPLFTPPLDTHNEKERTNVQLIDISLQDGLYVFSFEKLGFFLDFCRGKGVRFFEFSHLFSQWGAKYSPNIYASKNGVKKRIFSLNEEVDESGYPQFLSQLLKELIPFIQSKGIYENSFFHISDEPKEKDVEQYLRCKKILTEYVAEEKLTDALSDFSFYQKGVVQSPIVEIFAIDKFIEQNVSPLNVYYCFQHNANYVSNRHFSMPLQRTRIIGIQLYLNKIKTFLHWGFNFYNDFLSLNKINPYFVTDVGRFLPSGDGFVVYPNVKTDGVDSSLRLETLKDAFFDCRLLEAMERKKGREFVLELLKQEGLKGFTEYPRSISWHNGFVESLIRFLREE